MTNSGDTETRPVPVVHKTGSERIAGPGLLLSTCKVQGFDLGGRRNHGSPIISNASIGSVIKKKSKEKTDKQGI